MARKQAPQQIRYATPEEIARARGEAINKRMASVVTRVKHGLSVGKAKVQLVGITASAALGMQDNAEEVHAHKEAKAEKVWVVVDGKTVQVPSTAVCSA